jgi:hypothetical protein
MVLGFLCVAAGDLLARGHAPLPDLFFSQLRKSSNGT